MLTKKRNKFQVLPSTIIVEDLDLASQGLLETGTFPDASLIRTKKCDLSQYGSSSNLFLSLESRENPEKSGTGY